MALTLGVHGSVDAVFPPEALVDVLSEPAERVDAELHIVTSDDTTGLDGCDGIVTFAYDEAFLESGIDWIHSIQTGVDRFPLGDLEAAGIALTNSTGIHGDAIGDTVAGYMLSFARRLHVYRDRQRARDWSWPAFDEPFSLRGERLCVIGLGVLGRGIAHRADALGMDVVGVKRTPTPVQAVNEVYGRDGLHDAIADARFVALALPLTPESEDLIGAAELDRMPESAYLINVARGGIVVEAELIDALEAGTIAGAALDTFETEPLPEDSPLWGFEEVIVSPHAGAAHGEYAERVAEILVESLRRRTRGEEYANRVV